MKKLSWSVKLSLFLVAVTITIYGVKYLVIGDAGESNTLTYIFNALGFLPLNVLFVTLILNSLLSMRAKKEQQEKMKMIVGLFFSEFGTDLLRIFVRCDATSERLRSLLTVQKNWTKKEFSEAQKGLETYKGKLSPTVEDFAEIRTLLSNHHDFLLRLVENPVFLEHGKIASLMQALFHLSEELDGRGAFSELPRTDIAHLTGDISRVYASLVSEWLAHTEYLADNYPYLLSLFLRKSPFSYTVDVIVRE